MIRRIIVALCLLSYAILHALHTSAQGSSWFTPLNFGLIPNLFSVRYDDVYFVSHDTGTLVSSYGMIFKTYDGAAHWHLTKVTAEDVYFRSVEFSADGQVGIAGTLSGFVYRSADRGETWEDISASIHGPNTKNMCGLAHYGNTFYGVGWWGSDTALIYKSTDAGITWTTTYLDTGMVSGLVDVTFITANKGFATGTYKTGSKRASVVIRTLDGGSTWTRVFMDTTIGGRIWKIQFVDSAFGVGSVEPIYIDTVAMIKTVDGGDTWQLIPVGHVNSWPTLWGTQGIGFLNRNKGWIGGYYNGMFETNDGGATWDTLNIAEECDRFFLIDTTMYVSANTVYKYGDPSYTAVPHVSAPAYVHKLYPVAPNPSDGNVAIEFDIKEHSTNVLLEVVQLDGRKVYPVMKGYLKPGHYSYKWDGADAPPGNYIVWLGTDEIPMVERFVLNKYYMQHQFSS